MSPCAPDELSSWLAGKLSESPVSEFIPAANMAPVVNQIVAACYKDGRLETADLLKWFEGEFQVPRETLMPVMSGLKKEAAGLGVTFLLPWETHASTAAAAAPPPPAPAPARAPRPAPRPAQSAPPRKPPAETEMEFQHLSDFRFLEHAVYDYVLAQKHPDDMLVARMLVVNYQLGNDEIELLKTVEPDKPGDTLANWVLMLDGLNLGLHVAGLLVEDMPERQPEWSRGVRQVLARVSETASKILARQQKAKADQDPAFELFHNAWNRVRQNADTLDRRLKTLAGRELPSPLAPPSPAARPAAKPTRATENVEPFSSRQKLIIAGAGVVVLIAIVSCLYFLGVFAPKAEKVEIKLDASGLALPVLKSYTEGKAMVAEVDVNAWQALPESGQTEFLLALYDRAVKANAGQVQLRGGGKILGQAWSRNKIKIFSK